MMPLFVVIIMACLYGCGSRLDCLAADTRPHAPAFTVTKQILYSGTCDASAAVALDADTFAVGNDEDNRIRFYRRDQPGIPIGQLQLDDFLRVDPRKPEVDIEAATRVGNRTYWMGSEGRNKNGKNRDSRHRFFALETIRDQSGVRLKPIGAPYADLLSDMFKDPRLDPFHLREAALKPPKSKNALNIEGLCATPEGHLLIGFRNPIPKDKALLVSLTNPADLMFGKPAKFGAPILLDLDGHGIRDMTFHDGKYYIIAGSSGSKGHSKVYTWKGGSSKPHHLKNLEIKGLNPEAIIFYPDDPSGSFQLISDDGNRLKGGQECKSFPESQRAFRSVWVAHDPRPE